MANHIRTPTLSPTLSLPFSVSLSLCLCLSLMFECCSFRRSRYSPFGVLFLVSGQMLSVSQLGQQLRLLAAFVGVVSGGLAAQVILYHVIYLLMTRHNPLRLTWGVLQSLMVAFGTASRWDFYGMSFTSTRDFWNCAQWINWPVSRDGCSICSMQ